METSGGLGFGDIRRGGVGGGCCCGCGGGAVGCGRGEGVREFGWLVEGCHCGCVVYVCGVVMYFLSCLF